MSVGFDPSRSSLLCSATSLSPEDAVRTIFNDTEHRNEIIIFLHDQKSYQIRVINNKNQVRLFGFLTIKNKYILSSKEPLPFSLEQRLSSLCGESVSMQFGTTHDDKSFFDELDEK